jgi:glycosyltransferase involved in cell wall biosynthesis
MCVEIQLGLVSVIVASYNHAEYLEQRMESLINQTYKNLEILVIDDCSTDNSAEVLQRYQSDIRVQLILRDENTGWVGVSNQGVELSSGEFVIFANCDDTCDPYLIERLVHGLTFNVTAGVTFSRSLMIDERGEVIGDDFSVREKAFRKKCSSDVLLTKKEMSQFLLHSCVIPNLSAALFRVECFISAGGLSRAYSVCSDWDLFFRVVTSCDVAYIAEPLNHFRQHKATIRSSTKERKTYEEYFRLLLGQLREMELGPIERNRFRIYIMYLWSIHLISPSLVGIRNFPYHASRVIKYDPPAILFLGFGLAWRSIRLIGKSIFGRAR